MKLIKLHFVAIFIFNSRETYNMPVGLVLKHGNVENFF